MHWADGPQNCKCLYWILQGPHLDNFLLKTLKLTWVALHLVTVKLKCLECQSNQYKNSFQSSHVPAIRSSNWLVKRSESFKLHYSRISKIRLWLLNRLFLIYVGIMLNISLWPGALRNQKKKVLIRDIRVGFYWMSPDSRLMDEDFSENASKNFPSIIYLPCGLALP